MIKTAGFALTSAIAIAVLTAPIAGQAQPAPASGGDYQPSVGQAGKDVVWVPTPQALVDTMLDMAKLGKQDFLIDLGSGDGRTVITAAKRGVRALGIEYNPDMVELSKRAAAKEGVSDRAQFVKQDLFTADFSKATVITMFLLPDINLRLRPTLLKLKPGTRLVSNTFTMGEWTPDRSIQLDKSSGCETSWCTALLWIVPANAEGAHRIPQGELSLKQSFQMLTGTLRNGERIVPVEGRVDGTAVILKVDGKEMRGRMDGNRLVMG